MAIDLPTIRQRFAVDESGLGKLRGGLGGLGKMLGGAVAGGALVAGAGIAAFTAHGVQGAIEVDRGLREVVTLFGETGSAADDLFGELQSGVAGLSDELGVAQDEITGGLYSAISAGIPKNNAFDFMRTATKASIAGVTDVETAVDGITTTVNAFGLEADEAGAVADSMFAAVQGGKTTFEELSGSLYNVAPAAAAAGVSFEEVNAGIATLTAGGTPTAQATTQMRAALVGLQRPSEEMTSIFQDLGYENAQAAVESEGMAFALDAVADAADGDNGKLQQLLGSSEAVAAANVIAGTGAAKFAEEMDRQASSAGSVDTAFEQMNQSTSRQMEAFRTKLSNVAIQVGSVILPLINRALDSVIPVVERVAATVTSVLEALQSGGLASFVSAVTGWFGGGGEGGGGKVPAAFLFVAQVAGQMRDLVADVLVKLQEIIGGFVEVVVLLWGLLGDDIISIVRGLWQAVQGIFRGALDVITGVIDVFIGLFTGDWARMGDGIKSIIQGVWRAVAGIFSGAVGVIQGILGGLYSLIQRIFGNIASGIGTIVSNIWSSVTERFRNLASSLGGIVSGIWTTITSKFRQIKDSIVATARTIWTTVRDRFVAMKDAVSEQIGNLIDLVKDLPGRIMRGLGSLHDLLTDSGKDVVRGLWEGIKSMAGWIADKVKGFVKSAIPGPIARALGMASPSKVTAALGRQTAEGLAVGITDGRADVARAAGDLADAAARPIELNPTVNPRRGTATGTTAAGAGAGRTLNVDIGEVRALNPREATRQILDDLTWHNRRLSGSPA